MARVVYSVLALCLVVAVPVLGQTRSNRRCADTNKNCLMWAMAGECYHNAGFMFVHCAETCGQCRVHDPACSDEEDMCTAWAKVGECRRNKPFMERMCARACGFCSPASDHSVPHVRLPIKQRFWKEWSNRQSNFV